MEYDSSEVDDAADEKVAQKAPVGPCKYSRAAFAGGPRHYKRDFAIYKNPVPT